jgi:hypothetical protein
MAGSARLVTAAVVLALAPVAHAQPLRPVPVIDAGAGPASTAAAAALRRALRADPDLEPLPPGDLARALEAPPADAAEADPALASARRELDDAQAALDRFQTRACLAAARRAETVLLAARDGAGALPGLAEARFVAGLAHLRDQNRGLALASFALAARLDPARGRPDPARYRPEVLEAIARAGAAATPAVELRVTSTFDGATIELDGVRVGTTPWRGEAPAGLHVVRVASAGLRPDARVVELVEPQELRVDLAPLPLADRARELRREAAATDDPNRLRALLAAAVDLAAADAVLVVRDGAAGPEVALYERGPDRLSRPRAAADAAGLFGLLVPTASPDPLELLGPRDDGPWYARPIGIAGIAAAGLAGITAAILLSTGDAEVLPRSGTAKGLE